MPSHAASTPPGRRVRRCSGPILAAVALACSLVSSNSAAAGPITFNTALPVFSGEVIAREQLIWMRSTGDPTAMDRNLNVLATPTVLVYGAHPRAALFAVLPFLYKRISLVTPAGTRVTRSTTGFGDMTAFVRVTALQVDRPQETLRLAPFAGVKIPTGADDEGDKLGRFPQPFQLGSGSWDPIAGAVLTWQTLRWELDASGSYQLRSGANAFNAGDEVRGEASFQYRVIPWGAVGPGVPDWLFAVIETNAVRRGRNKISGVDDPDSGSFIWYVAPGLQWITRRTVLEAALQIPVVQNTNGRGLGQDFVARVSLRVNF